ncbi:MAG: hypothetical protein HY784_07395, partial [Chloroflexi bacterium]|nr:hypothetical protein [Chloroflexota bacterium]
MLLGIAWFSWCFAALWWALRRRDRTSLALAAACVAMVLTAGGGYYPFYLLGSLSVLVGVALLLARTAADRRRRLRRAVAVAALSAGLTAVMLLPLLDGYRYTSRDAAPDPTQHFSQPIPYALINYVVSQPEWFRTEILGTAGGWNWFYLGWLPLAALALVPLALGRARARRPALIAVTTLTFTLLAWHASKYAPVKYIYSWIPFLYTLRFPNRLLILAASPLLVLAALGLQVLWNSARGVGRSFILAITRKNEAKPAAPLALSLAWVLEGALLLLLLLSARDVYTVNKGFAFANQSLDQKGPAALGWLKNYDPTLYYLNMGAG